MFGCIVSLESIYLLNVTVFDLISDYFTNYFP